MGLFSKKSCSICGGEIGLLGNRKLEDGNLCKQCAAKLSPFFRERRSSTVAEIADQLAYREANKAEVAAFRVTRSLGDRTKVLLDEEAQKFIVTSQTRWADANPDVIKFSDVTGCSYTIDEDRREVEHELPAGQTPGMQAQMAGNYRGVPGAPGQGGMQNFAAQRNAPARPQSDFGARAGMAAGAAPRPMNGGPAYGAPAAPRPMNGAPARPGTPGYGAPAYGAQGQYGAAAQPQTYIEYKYSYDFQMTINVNNPYFDTIQFQVNDDNIDDMNSPAYAMCWNMCEEIKAVLLGIHEDVRQARIDAAAPKAAVTCARCGATTMPDASGCCEYCGGPVA